MLHQAFEQMPQKSIACCMVLKTSNVIISIDMRPKMVIFDYLVNSSIINARQIKQNSPGKYMKLRLMF